jgi:hypothetical protein
MGWDGVLQGKLYGSVPVASRAPSVTVELSLYRTAEAAVPTWVSLTRDFPRSILRTEALPARPVRPVH